MDMISGGLSDSRKIGFGLTAFGVLFTMLGILFFFDQALLAMGNVRARERRARPVCCARRRPARERCAQSLARPRLGFRRAARRRLCFWLASR